MQFFWRNSKASNLPNFPTELLCFRSLSDCTVSPSISSNVTSLPVAETPSVASFLPPSNQGYRIFQLFGGSTDFHRNQQNAAVENLVQNLVSAGDQVSETMDEKVKPTLSWTSGQVAFIDLMTYLVGHPQLALEVVKWRRNVAESGIPMTAEQYSKCIAVAGRLKNVALALELFEEANRRNLNKISIYNALLGAYMYNFQSDKCQRLYKDMKNQQKSASSVTCNILISTFGRTLLVDQMEQVIRDMVDLHLSPSRGTFNLLISGYVSAWMWDNMENVFFLMQESTAKPDLETYMLMLRGYALSNNLEKMESTYEVIKDHVNRNEMGLIRCMISAYSRSSVPDKVEKLESLLSLIPEEDYRAWLNVQLIRFYANEDMLEKMESFIELAFKHNTIVSSVHVMRAISGAYFRLNTLGSLTDFLRRAEVAGWKLCRSLYHCKMIMCGAENRLLEMEGVVNEMEKLGLDITRKTLIILRRGYLTSGQLKKAKIIAGFMCKIGCEIRSNCSL